LKKKPNYIKAFDNFDIEKIAAYKDDKIEELMSDSGIVRNRLKIQSAVRNACVFLGIQSEFGTFDSFIWGFTDGKTIHGNYKNLNEVPVNNHLSDLISKELKSRGMNFVGTTIIYAYLQAIGILNDHTTDCFRYSELQT
jgi:DNA-3-methyladenine glycosylase I